LTFLQYEIEPRYEFGFGLSYTTFQVSNLKFTQKQQKSALPAPPPSPLSPPKFSDKLPDVSEALIPAGFKKINKFVYPYISSAKEIVTKPFPYPDGYNTAHPPSSAGGGEGGNPALWETVGEITVTVENTGDVTGKEVVQLYVGFPENEPRLKTGDVDDAELGEFVDFPVKQLRGFEKVELKKGEKKTITLEVMRRDVSYWCVVRQNWIMPTSGKVNCSLSRHSPLDAYVLRFEVWMLTFVLKFTFYVGHSSRNLPLTVTW
jgi:hypothetical protein